MSFSFLEMHFTTLYFFSKSKGGRGGGWLAAPAPPLARSMENDMIERRILRRDESFWNACGDQVETMLT